MILTVFKLQMDFLWILIQIRASVRLIIKLYFLILFALENLQFEKFGVKLADTKGKVYEVELLFDQIKKRFKDRRLLKLVSMLVIWTLTKDKL